MRFPIKVFLEQLRSWFPQAEAELKAQTAELRAHLQPENVTPLSPCQLKTLRQRIDALPIPSPYLNAIKSELSQAISQWQEQEDAPNSLVVLTSPIEPLGKIIQATSADWTQENLWLRKSLFWSTRPASYSTVKSQLLPEINLAKEMTREQQKQTVLIVIPDLSWCFLRSVNGLDVIESLQDLLFQDPSHFWLIGCNSWAWAYLEVVCQISGYLSKTFSLPDLGDLQLKEWLTPVSETLPLDLSNDYYSENNQWEEDNDNHENWVSASEQSYFNQLANISLGLSSMAARLWLLSLAWKNQQEKSELSNSAESEHTPSKTLILEKATLPKLPNLTQAQRHLLFSLCLHGEMTLSELALSLGERPSLVQTQVQLLCYLGLLERRRDLFKINPAYYYQLKKDLADNRFLVGEGK
jgi:hypothetical protein